MWLPRITGGYHRTMSPNVLRGLVVVAVLAILVVSAIPLLILLDLAGDGSGWGLCEDGLDTCRVGPFSGGRLAAILLGVLFGMAALLRFIVWIASRSAERKAVPSSTADFFIPE